MAQILRIIETETKKTHAKFRYKILDIGENCGTVTQW